MESSRPAPRLTLSSWWAHLPVVLALVALCLILHHWSAYQRLEGAAVYLVGTLAPKHQPEQLSSGRIVALHFTPDFFASPEGFQRRLPLNRGTLAKVVDTVAQAQPTLIALDIDAVRAGDSDAEREEARQLHQAIERALARRIDVVAVTFPHALPITQANLDAVMALCQLDAPAPRATRGRFVLASPTLQQEGAFQVVYRVPIHPPSPDGQERRMAQVVAQLMGRHGAGQAHLANLGSLCQPDEDQTRHALQTSAQTASHGTHGGPEAVQLGHIRFLNRDEYKRLTALPISDWDDLHTLAGDLTGRVVFIGAQSFPGLDTYLTPLGPMPGVLVHAHIANSIDQGMHASTLLSTLLDIALGMLFVLVCLLIHAGHHWTQHKSSHLDRLYLLLVPMLAYTVFLFGALWLSAEVYARGLWIDPIPILVGLSLHLYVETNAASAGHATASLRAWGQETLKAWGTTLMMGRARPTTDVAILGLIRLTMLIVVGWGIYIGFIGGHH